METKFPKGILEETFVTRNHFLLNKNSAGIDNTPRWQIDDGNNLNSQPGPSRDATRGSSPYFGYDYYNYDYIWWLYLCNNNYGYYPVSFYHRNYYTTYGNGNGTGGISVYSGGDISGGGGTVDGEGGEIIGQDGDAFDGDDPIEIDGGDGGEANGGFDDGAGHDTFADGGDGGDGDGGDGE